MFIFLTLVCGSVRTPHCWQYCSLNNFYMACPLFFCNIRCYASVHIRNKQKICFSTILNSHIVEILCIILCCSCLHREIQIWYFCFVVCQFRRSLYLLALSLHKTSLRGLGLFCNRNLLYFLHCSLLKLFRIKEKLHILVLLLIDTYGGFSFLK